MPQRRRCRSAWPAWRKHVDLLGHGTGDAGVGQGRLAHGSEHGDAQGDGHVEAVFGRGALRRPLRRAHHGNAADGVHRHHIRAASGSRIRRTLDLVRDIVELKVQKHLEAALFQRIHHRRAVGVEQRHADLHPRGLALQLVGQLESLPRCRSPGDDDAVALGDIGKRG